MVRLVHQALPLHVSAIGHVPLQWRQLLLHGPLRSVVTGATKWVLVVAGVEIFLLVGRAATVPRVGGRRVGVLGWISFVLEVGWVVCLIV